MNRLIKKCDSDSRVVEDGDSLGDSVENFKRRRALPARWHAGMHEKDILFFHRLMNVKKGRDLVFVTKAEASKR